MNHQPSLENLKSLLCQGQVVCMWVSVASFPGPLPGNEARLISCCIRIASFQAPILHNMNIEVVQVIHIRVPEEPGNKASVWIQSQAYNKLGQRSNCRHGDSAWEHITQPAKHSSRTHKSDLHNYLQCWLLIHTFDTIAIFYDIVC